MSDREYKNRGFEWFDERGFQLDKVRIVHEQDCSYVEPAYPHESCKSFSSKGSKVKFLNRNGYDAELNRARSVFNEGQILTVKSCQIGDWSSDYSFEEVDGLFNTVMFEKV